LQEAHRKRKGSAGGKERIKTSHNHNKKRDKTIKNRAKIKRLEKNKKTLKAPADAIPFRYYA